MQQNGILSALAELQTLREQEKVLEDCIVCMKAKIRLQKQILGVLKETEFRLKIEHDVILRRTVSRAKT